MTKKIKAYLGGHMLDKANVMLRGIERDAINKLGNVELFNPADSPINNKATMPLAERIFAVDTQALLESEVVIFDISGTTGTSMEVAQVWTMNFFLGRLQEILFTSENDTEVADKLQALLHEIPQKKVMWKSEDIRDHNEPEVGYRRTHSYNAYLMGCLLDLSGEPKTFDEILEELKKEKAY